MIQKHFPIIVLFFIKWSAQKEESFDYKILATETSDLEKHNKSEELLRFYDKGNNYEQDFNGRILFENVYSRSFNRDIFSIEPKTPLMDPYQLDSESRNQNSKTGAYASSSSELNYGNWGLKYNRNKNTGSKDFQFGNSLGFVGIGVDDYLTKKQSLGFGNTVISLLENKIRDGHGIEVVHGNYGVNVNNIENEKLSSIGILSDGFATYTVTDWYDQDISQSIRINNYEIGLRHDFDNFLNNETDEFGTEISFLTPRFDVNVGTSVSGQKYGVDFSKERYKIAFQEDFDDKISQFEAKWGHGWNLNILENSDSDRDSSSMRSIGVGKHKLAYAEVSRGFNENGERTGGLGFEMPDLSFTAEVSDTYPNKSLKYTLHMGKLVYVGDAEITPENNFSPFFDLISRVM